MLIASRLPLPRSKRAALLLALPALGLSVGVLLMPPDLLRMAGLGYAGVFLSTLIASGAMVLPMPYMATIFAAARSLDPNVVALVAGLAAALGEFTGYLLGASGRVAVEHRGWLARLTAWRGLRGFLAVLALSVVPNPAFDAVGIAAGAVGLPAWRFGVATFVGKTLRFLLVAFVGHRYFPL